MAYFKKSKKKEGQVIMKSAVVRGGFAAEACKHHLCLALFAEMSYTLCNKKKIVYFRQIWGQTGLFNINQNVCNGSKWFSSLIFDIEKKQPEDFWKSPFCRSFWVSGQRVHLFDWRFLLFRKCITLLLLIYCLAQHYSLSHVADWEWIEKYLVQPASEYYEDWDLMLKMRVIRALAFISNQHNWPSTKLQKIIFNKLGTKMHLCPSGCKHLDWLSFCMRVKQQVSLCM